VYRRRRLDFPAPLSPSVSRRMICGFAEVAIARQRRAGVHLREEGDGATLVARGVCDRRRVHVYRVAREARGGFEPHCTHGQYDERE
jgi:hypothetical protein